MRPHAPPPPTYAFGYLSPPESGNAINGLGETRRRRARQVFHSSSGEVLAWKALDDFFSFVNPWSVVRHVLANTWQLRRSDGPVHPVRREVADPAAMAAEVKTLARSLGAGLVGVAEVTDDALYEGRDPGLRYAICLALPMDWEEMRFAPQPRAAAEVMRTYRAAARVAVRLAERIRAMGWPARAYGNPNSTDILLIPLAIRAGIGELGKHASMISAGYGSNFRLAAVLTDLPLATDSPVDIGVEDLCAVCRRCVDDCPPRAVFEDKQIVRGERKWYVDFDRCIPYFVKTVGCAICIEVCPWSEPGRGPELSARLLRKRAPGASPPRGPDPGPAGVEGARPSGAAILRMRRGLDRLGAIRRSLARWSVTARGRRTLIGALVVLALAAAGGLGYMKLVEKGFLRYNKWDRRVRGTLRIGDQAPDLELTTYDGSRLRLSALWAKKPVVLVFGSCT